MKQVTVLRLTSRSPEAWDYPVNGTDDHPTEPWEGAPTCFALLRKVWSQPTVDGKAPWFIYFPLPIDLPFWFICY